jgi:hypothetical protein
MTARALALSAAIISVIAVAEASPLSAQAMRDFSAARQRHGATRLIVRLDFAAGAVDLRPGRGDDLYRYDVRYDADRFSPLVDFDASASSVALGLRNIGGAGLRVSNRQQLQQAASVQLSPDVALAVEASLGAVEGDLELGGLRLTDLRLSTGASRTTVRFSRPNRVRCTSALFLARATELSVESLGNSRCGRVVLKGTMGSVLLDLSGGWQNGDSLDLALTVGELTLRVPRSVGLRVTADRFLASFPDEGWTRSGAELLSPGYANASRKLNLMLAANVGSVRFDWR